MNSTVDRKIKNEIVRKQFDEYYKLKLKPNLIIVANEIGINYAYFMRWKSGKLDLGYKKLDAMRNFLDKQK